MFLETYQFILLAFIAVLLAFSAFFSSQETSYTGLSLPRLKGMDPEQKDKRIQRAIQNYENFDRLLTTILVGNNIVNTAQSAVCTVLLISLIPDWGALIATILMITVLLVVGEITPKTLAKKHPEKTAIRYAGAIHQVMVVLTPISAVFGALPKVLSRKKGEPEPPTDEETTAIIDEILEEGTMEEEENKLIRSAMSFDDKTVGEICIPRVDIVALNSNTNLETIKSQFVQTEFSRIPIYENSIDHVIGYISMKDFLLSYASGNPPTGIDQIHPVIFFPETAGLDDVFREMQRSKSQIAIILDDFGGTAGMVTMEDLLEELVGEIYDESDEVEYTVVQEKDGSYTVPGDANIFEVMEELNLEFACEEFDSVTVGGYIAFRLQRIPRVGDEVDTGNATITVKQFRNRRVKEASIRIKDPVPEVPETEQ